jgi:serine protease AprX
VRMGILGRPHRTTCSGTWARGASVAVLSGLAWTMLSGVPAQAHDELPDETVQTTEPTVDTDWGDVTHADSMDALDTSGTWTANRDEGSLYTISSGYGIQAAWSSGVTGKGVTVAVIDTGIAPVVGLDNDHQVVNGPDLSYDGQTAGTRYIDGYGHGTHLAAIIAGRDDHFDAKKPKPDKFAGIAPNAQLLNMKVGAGDGGADVSQVIAALDWVTAHRRDHGMNVRVVSLAYGTASVQPWQVDPLALAVENAWRAGLVVVVAAGNEGLDASSLLMPAADPHVLAVGAVDNVGTATHADDVVAEFTNGGNSDRRPDVLAPGKSVVSLRVPGSYVDSQHPEGLVAGDKSSRFFRGSGTSQATAVASGEVALLLQARPNLTPDQVKALLMATADPLVQNPNPAMGAGVLNLAGALTADVPSTSAASLLPESTGTGSLEASRGGTHVLDPANGAVLSGEVDALGSPWDAAAWSAASRLGSAWSAGMWNGRVWTGSTWAKDDWKPATWTGNSWSGIAWASQTWSDAAWVARSWHDESWHARSWHEASWHARSWHSLP